MIFLKFIVVMFFLIHSHQNYNCFYSFLLKLSFKIVLSLCLKNITYGKKQLSKKKTRRNVILR